MLTEISVNIMMCLFHKRNIKKGSLVINSLFISGGGIYYLFYVPFTEI